MVAKGFQGVCLVWIDLEVQESKKTELVKSPKGHRMPPQPFNNPGKEPDTRKCTADLEKKDQCAGQGFPQIEKQVNLVLPRKASGKRSPGLA